jgi:hypothetical protein
MSTGSGAGLTRVTKTRLTTAAASANSGIQRLAAKAFTKWEFSLNGSFTGYSVAIYGTIDPGVITYPSAGPYLSGPYAATAGYPAPGAANSSWFLLPSPADQTGAGTETNPLVAVGVSLYFQGPLTAVGCVATGSSQTGTVSVLAMAAP